MEFTKKYYAATPGGASGGGTGGGGNASRNAANNTQAAADAAQDLQERLAALGDALLSIGQSINRQITDNIRQADRATAELGKTLGQKLKGTFKSLGKDSEEILSNTLALEAGSLKVATVQRQLATAAKKQLIIQKDLEIARNAGLLTATQFNNKLKEIQAAYADHYRLLKLQSIEADRMERAMGSLGKAVKGMSKIPLFGDLINTERVLGKMQEVTGAGGGKLKAFGAGISEAFKSVGESLTDPFTILPGLIGGFIKLVKLAAEYQSKQFEAAKDLGVSVNRGKELRDSFVAIARSNMQLGVTADMLQKSYAGVQNELGIIVKQSGEFNLSTTLIERRIGATSEHMATLQFAAKKVGSTLMDTYQTIIGSAKAEGGRVKLALSEKQILDEISKVSATVYQNFKGNYAQIAAAVVEAKKLGVTLDQINGIQGQFLDFETSIQKQFEAEVLTGEELNLTRIRDLALRNKTKELMQEVVKLTGKASEWNKLDYITQTSKAEALGLTRDAISKMLMDQEKMNALGAAAGADLQTQYNLLEAQGKSRAQIASIMGQEATQSAYMASVSEKLAAIMDGIKNTIAQMATALLPLVEKVMNWLANTENLKKTLSTIAGIITGIVSYSIALRTITAATTAMTYRKLVAENTTLATQQRQVTVAGFQLASSRAQAATDAVSAGARVTAGSWYLGPGAAAVGAAAIALLMGYLGSSAASGAMEGGGGGGTEITVPSTPTPTTGIAPMNVPAATAAASNSTSAAATSTAGLTNVTGRGSAGDVYIDGQKVGQVLFNQTHDQVTGKDKT